VLYTSAATFSVAALPAGIYLLTVDTPRGAQTSKLHVAH
jgi:hypothetical protein